jgi:hypothetical protein
MHATCAGLSVFLRFSSPSERREDDVPGRGCHEVETETGEKYFVALYSVYLTR